MCSNGLIKFKQFLLSSFRNEEKNRALGAYHDSPHFNWPNVDRTDEERERK